ncbi:MULTISPECIES: hypothetical protein [Campylobacter]|uniref:hypothetical protein n=1 Tax=Campylobacter TaxID=194 RepID=UPI00027A3873|nr:MULTISPECIES: hypothetical protein [Campylobacter]EJP74270.1 hypothetical protein HMPREF1139_1065 [Campylobacter sp. FOBRC14]
MRKFVNFANGDEINFKVSGNLLVSQSTKNGKMRENKKEFVSPEEAQKARIKKEWETLKKGYVLRDENANFAQVCLHVYIGGGYSGALAFESVGESMFVYKCGDQKDDDEKDFLLALDKDGRIKEQIVLPEILAWEAARAGENLILDLDHVIYKFDPRTGEFTNLSNELNLCDSDNFYSFVCKGKSKVAFGASGKIFVTDGERILNFGEFKTTPIKGKAPLCAAFDDDRLALHTAEGEIKILGANGEILNVIEGKFDVLDQICFLNDKTLVAREYYRGKVHCFELSNGRELKFGWQKECGEARKICVNDERTKLVMIDYNMAYLVDLASQNVCEFEIEHIVKSCEAKFIDKNLAVRTDYGCFSLYNI